MCVYVDSEYRGKSTMYLALSVEKEIKCKVFSLTVLSRISLDSTLVTLYEVLKATRKQRENQQKPILYSLKFNKLFSISSSVMPIYFNVMSGCEWLSIICNLATSLDCL